MNVHSTYSLDYLNEWNAKLNAVLVITYVCMTYRSAVNDALRSNVTVATGSHLSIPRIII